MPNLRTPRYGRRLADFAPGATYAHPWEVTIDEGMVALFAASMPDATPVYASREEARSLGFRDRPLPPMLLLNLALSFSVHDVSEHAIAHLAYLDVRFPAAAYACDTVRAWSTVVDARPASSGDRGVVRVRTALANQNGAVVCAFDRKALVSAGRNAHRPADAPADVAAPGTGDLARLPPELRARIAPARGPRFGAWWEDFEVGDVIAHDVGRTVGESEHMQLATLTRNTHPLHTDETYARAGSFAKTRVVYGGLVLAWTLALASRDTAGNALWELGLDEGAHPSGVVAGDTLYAATKVLAKEDRGDAGAIVLRVVGVKNEPARALIERGVDLFEPEFGKKGSEIAAKVVEITRTLLMRKKR